MKKFQLIKVSMIAASLSMAACTTATATKMDASKEKYEAALAAATAAGDKAAKVGGEWRDTRWDKSEFVSYTGPDGKTIKSSYMGAAAEAAAHGDYAKAIDWLETAKFQGEMGYEQAMGQKDAGPRL
jgi:hypothetical protein